MAEDRPVAGAFHRINSESGLMGKDLRLPKSFERTQSEMNLSKNGSKVLRSLSFEKDTPCAASTGKVSEHSQVYWDLSKAGEENKVAPGGRLKIHLQTIHQKEELHNDSGETRRRFSVEYKRTSSGSTVASVASSSTTATPPVYSKSGCKKLVSAKECKNEPMPTKVTTIKKKEFLPSTKRTLQTDLAAFKAVLKQSIIQLQGESIPTQCEALDDILQITREAWATPQYGRDLAYSLCDCLRNEGGLDIVIKNCGSVTYDIQLGSARVLEQTLTTDNRDHVVDNGLDIVVTMSRRSKEDLQLTRVSTGILENMFKHSENTCRKVINLGGLGVLLYACRYSDKETQRHCAVALANLAIFGGAENQHEMIRQKTPEWLFPLAFSEDDSIRYYACLAITALSANKEIEAAVVNSGTLDLVTPFITTHSPQEFAYSDRSHIHGRAKEWLVRLIPVLSSKRQEAQSLAAFHFAMEAGIKVLQGRKEIFSEIGAIDALKLVASCPNKLASKFAREALNILGEEIPYLLSQQVPLWTVQDVQHWVSQVGFGEFRDAFVQFQVDGDLLLMLSGDNLHKDINMANGITRLRFLRELGQLKKSADYSCCDPSNMNEWIKGLSSELCKYTYQMVRCGVDKNLLPALTEEQLASDCGIRNGIDRMKILQAARDCLKEVDSASSLGSPGCCVDGTDSIMSRPIDVFISYRRSNGSQLASLLKVHLQLRGFVVFLDIERLRAGKFDMNLLNSVKNANNFVLVLTPGALDRCVGDNDQRDWVHKEIVAAIDNSCNIIPIMDNFDWPASESLPQDMRAVSYFNGIRWIHDYQDACVEKLERFLRGEVNGKQGRMHDPSCLPKASSVDLLSPVSEMHGHGPIFKGDCNACAADGTAGSSMVATGMSSVPVAISGSLDSMLNN